jgi:hypothetical protein
MRFFLAPWIFAMPWIFPTPWVFKASAYNNMRCNPSLGRQRDGGQR